MVDNAAFKSDYLDLCCRPLNGFQCYMSLKKERVCCMPFVARNKVRLGWLN